MPIQHIATDDIAHAIRAGLAWRLEYSANVNNGATVTLGMVTGSRGAIISDRAFVALSTTAAFVFYRATSFTGGVAGTLRNRNDRYWGQAALSPLVNGQFWTGVTATPAAADIMSSLTLISPNGPAQQVVGIDAAEVILAPNTSYVLTIANQGANPAVCGLSAVLIQDRLSDGALR